MWQWLSSGLREAAVMVWMTFWPLVLGFGVSGLVQSLFPRDGLRARLGHNSWRSVTLAAVLGSISSSCSYAASAMARALMGRGASLTTSMVFMVASTNLVIELGVVLFTLLGWPFVVAQFVGGAVMIVLLAALVPLAFRAHREEELLTRVRGEVESAPMASTTSTVSWRDSTRYVMAARYTKGDLTMVRNELVIGFLVSGFLTVHVPASWWSHIFMTGHGWWTDVENALIAPFVAVISFVCSVGNIPLAAALWMRGVSFGGVIAFIFADLVTLPLLGIYRRFYGTKNMVRLAVVLWVTMSAGGLAVNALFGSVHAIPSRTDSPLMTSHFEGGATLALNLVAVIVLAGILIFARRDVGGALATDPICGMSVDVSAPAATRRRGTDIIYFCSPHCADRFDTGDSDSGMHEDIDGDQVDPICGMRVSSQTGLSGEKDGVTYYFCGEGCRQTFLEGPSRPVTLGRKPQ